MRLSITFASLKWNWHSCPDRQGSWCRKQPVPVTLSAPAITLRTSFMRMTRLQSIRYSVPGSRQNLNMSTAEFSAPVTTSPASSAIWAYAGFTVSCSGACMHCQTCKPSQHHGILQDAKTEADCPAIFSRPNRNRVYNHQGMLKVFRNCTRRCMDGRCCSERRWDHGVHVKHALESGGGEILPVALNNRRWNG